MLVLYFNAHYHCDFNSLYLMRGNCLLTGLLLWTQIRQQWVGDKKARNQPKMREPRLRYGKKSGFQKVSLICGELSLICGFFLNLIGVEYSFES